MKKQTLLAALFIALGIAASAQTLTQEKIVGKWKVIAMQGDSLRIDLADPEAMKTMMFTNDLKKDPGKVFTEEDSSTIAFAAELLHAMFSHMEFAFNANGKYGITIDATLFGQRKKETTKGEYTIKKGNLYLTEGKKLETITASMPDAKTLVFSNFGSAKGMNIILEKQ